MAPCLSRLSRILATLALGTALGSSIAMAQTAVEAGDAGSYLAARSAEQHGDFRSAAAWYARALVADPGNPRLLDGALFAELNLGDIDLAAQLAHNLIDKGGKSQLADMAMMAKEAKAEDYAALVKAAADGRKVGPVLDELTLAWAKLGEGHMSDALAAFDSVSQTKGMEAFGLYHKAIAMALAGDFEGADEILSGRASGPLHLNRRGLLAHVEILSQLERNADAIKLMDDTFGTEPEPALDALRARLAAGEPVPFDTVTSPRDGIAEVFFTVATALNGDADPTYTLLHSQLATALRPDHTEARLLSAAMLEDLGQYDLAVEIYAQFKPDDPAFYSAEMGRANALYALGNKDAAIEALQALARGPYAGLITVQSALADILRREERFAEAIPVYDAAIALAKTPVRQHWTLFFSRGICLEHEKDWPKAEADFRKALELNPGEPRVLNYLGYTFVDRGENLDEALKLIQQAVLAEPEAGYIIDSLAWAYFRLGRYDEALHPMEKASLLEPVDPVVTDHLGDVYWAVGRQREAEFQWHRALSFNPTEKDATRIRRKLEIGLDAVLAEEGAKPLSEVKAAANGN